MPFDGMDRRQPRDSTPVGNRVRAVLAAWRPLDAVASRKPFFPARIRLRPVHMIRALMAIGAVLCRCGVRALAPGADRYANLRGTEDLKLTLRLRFSRGPPSAAQINDAAAAIDAAATGVERA